MKTNRKNTWARTILAVCLSALMLLDVLPVAAFAAEPAEKQVRFIVGVDDLLGIDFSGLIRDKSTISKGKIVLDNPGDTDEDWEGVWNFVEIDEAGVARFFYWTDDGEKVYSSIPLGVYNWEAEVRAVNGYLFDDVASYSFSLEDVYASSGMETFWVDNHPLVEVTKCDGDIVREMEFNFAPTDDAYDDRDILPLTVDMDKEITLTVYLIGSIQCTYSLVPVRYDGKGTLTVSVRNSDGSEGVALHHAEIRSGDAYVKLYSFDFAVPHGLFRYKNMVSEGFWTTEYTDIELWGMPVWTIVDIHMPNLLVRFAEAIQKLIPSSMRKLFYMALIPVVFPFPITRIYRALRNSFAAYGLDLDTMAKDAIRSGRLMQAIAGMWMDLFKESL